MIFNHILNMINAKIVLYIKYDTGIAEYFNRYLY